MRTREAKEHRDEASTSSEGIKIREHDAGVKAASEAEAGQSVACCANDEDNEGLEEEDEDDDEDEEEEDEDDDCICELRSPYTICSNVLMYEYLENSTCSRRYHTNWLEWADIAFHTLDKANEHAHMLLIPSLLCAPLLPLLLFKA